MDRFALTAFYRSLVRHRLYAAINIGGLAVGIAVFLMLTIYVRFETRYEHWLPGWRDIHLVKTRSSENSDRRFYPNSPSALWTAIARDDPRLIGTRFIQEDGTVIRDGIGIEETFALVDPDFPKVFRLPVVAGDFDGAFNDPTNVVLTEKTAHAVFGERNAIGRTMTIGLFGKSSAYRVAAVVRDMPADTFLRFDMLARKTIDDDVSSPQYNSDHQWNYSSGRTFVVANGRAGEKRVTDVIGGVSRRHATSETPDNPGYRMDVRLQPLGDVHLDQPGAKLAIATIGIVGVLTLLLAVVNYVNLATARAGLRAREVAMRKVLGADRGTLFRYYVAEALATAAIAALIGLALTEAAMPVINAAADIRLEIDYFGRSGVLPLLVPLVLLVGSAAGTYPAIILSRFPAAAVLASARTPGGGRTGARVREVLVIAQFAIAIAFMVGTLVLTAQTRYVRNADVGFQRQGLMLVPSLGMPSINDAQRDTIMHRLSALPGVVSASIANNAPGPNGLRSTSNLAIPGQAGNGAELRFFETTPGFFETVGAHVIAGRLFDASRQADVNANYDPATGNSSPRPYKPYNIVVNRSALRALHIASPQAAIGRSFASRNDPARTIIGVIEDMRFADARAPIEPAFYDFVVKNPRPAIGILRFTGDPREMYAAMQAVWRQEAPEVPFYARTAVQNMAILYAADDRTAHLFTIGAVLAVAIGCVGLWGLASFNTARRVREIGIRKTLGASTADVVKLLVGQFLRPVLVANIVAWPLAFFAMRTWLAGFDDRIALSPLYFLGATALALTIAVLTVLAQSLRAARATPAWALRHE